MPRLAQTGPVRCALLLALADRGEAQAVVMLVRRSAEALAPGDVEHASALVQQTATAMALVQARAEAGTDAVTGSMNHRAMRRRLGEEIDRASRGGGLLSCLLIDLDDFKAVNDLYGHAAGDALLRSVVQALVGEFRAFDRVARYGGDEFVVILPNAGRRGGRGRRLPRALAAADDPRRGRHGPRGLGLDRRGGLAGADGHRRAARGGRRRPAALQAPGQGSRHAGARPGFLSPAPAF